MFVNVTVSSTRRGAVYPSGAAFTPADWSVPKASGFSRFEERSVLSSQHQQQSFCQDSTVECGSPSIACG